MPTLSRPSVRLLFLCSTILAGCTGGGGESTDLAASGNAMVDTVTFSAEAVKIAGLEVDTVRAAGWQATVTVPGRVVLDPAALETIGSITEGRITGVPVRVGDRVVAGQTLVMIHSHEIMDARSRLLRARAQLDAATAQRDLAVTEAARAHRLFDARAMSRAEVERAEVALRVARAAWDEATAEHDRAIALVDHLAGLGPLPPGADEHDVLIRTPIAGVVTERVAQPGSVVLPGSPLLTVGDPARLLLQLHLSESAAAGITVGSAVRYTLTESPGAPFSATVTRIAPTMDTLTRTIEVVARPTGSTPVRAESFVQAVIVGKGTGETLTVASGALQHLDEGTVVFTARAQAGGLALRAVPVRVGRRGPDRAEILAGVAAGTPIVVRGAAIAKAELIKRRGGLGE